jgi:hypothetical protein
MVYFKRAFLASLEAAKVAKRRTAFDTHVERVA